jgi:hypothetical protein
LGQTLAPGRRRAVFAGPIQGPPAEGQQAGQQKVTFYQWQGFRVKPKAQGTQAVVLAPRAGSSNAVAVACDDLTSGPMPTEEHEPVIFDAVGSKIQFFANKSINIESANGAVLQIDANGNIYAIPASGKDVRLGTGINAQLDKVVTRRELQAALDLIAGHQHPETGTTTGTSPTLTPPALDLSGSPNVYAKKP